MGSRGKGRYYNKLHSGDNGTTCWIFKMENCDKSGFVLIVGRLTKKFSIL